MSALLTHLFAAMNPQKPNPLTAGTVFGGKRSPPNPTPVPTLPGMTGKTPPKPTPIPTGPEYGAPRSTLLGGSLTDTRKTLLGG